MEGLDPSIILLVFGIRILRGSIIVVGENGTVKLSGQYMDKLEYCDIKDYEMPVLDPPNPPNDYGDYKGSDGKPSLCY